MAGMLAGQSHDEEFVLYRGRHFFFFLLPSESDVSSASKGLLQEHLNLHRLEASHYNGDRSTEAWVLRETIGKFGVMLIIQILLIRDLPYIMGRR